MIRLFFFLIPLLCALLPSFAHAQDRKSRDYETMSMEEAQSMEETGDLSAIPGVRLRKAGVEPIPTPHIPTVKFLKIEKPATVGAMVESLVQGIYTDIPPQYDHFGYEMRHFMAGIGGPDVIGDPKRLYEEITNVRKAAIILKYWKEDIGKKSEEIETLIENNKTTSSRVRSEFRHSRGIVNAFAGDCQRWISTNQNFLEFLLAKQGAYKYNDPVITFTDSTDRMDFIAIFNAREAARAKINEYLPFAKMPY
ncbi:MAG: hypothetical protein K9G62_05860 [Alphaproteobacteria bacterium]|nr:hypothetical protein [Alphaproteobacteria bacterium]